MSLFVDIIGDIVTEVRAEYDTANIPVKTPYYLYGHPIEIFNILAEKSQSETYKYDKYPLIALFQDFKEENSQNRLSVYDVTIVIMTETDPNYRAANRYTNTFTPTLHPIYNLFMKYLIESFALSSDDNYKHTKIDRLYWGVDDRFGNMGNIGNDALDAVVLQNFKFEIQSNCYEF